MATSDTNVWDAPLDTTGVLEAADQPAPPSEQVADAPAPQVPDAQAPQEPKADDTPEAAQALDWQTAPEVFRAAHEADKPLREFAKAYGGVEKLREYVEPLRDMEREVGGIEQLREAVEFDNLMRNPVVPVEQKLAKLRALSEVEYDRITVELVEQGWRRGEWQDYLLTQRFGMTAEAIEQALKGTAAEAAPPQQPSAADPLAYAREVLADPYASEHDKGLAAAYVAQAEALAKVPTLEKEVSTLREQITSGSEADKAQKREVLAGEFLQSGFSPVDEVIKAAGLLPVTGDPPEEVERKAYAAERVRKDVFAELYGDAIINPNHPNHALAKELDGYLQNLDRGNAWRRLPKVQALAEMAAQRYVRHFSATFSQSRQAQSEPLKREPNPPVVHGQGASFGNSDPLPNGRAVWDDPNMGTRWQEIASE